MLTNSSQPKLNSFTSSLIMPKKESKAEIVGSSTYLNSGKISRDLFHALIGIKQHSMNSSNLSFKGATYEDDEPPEIIKLPENIADMHLEHAEAQLQSEHGEFFLKNPEALLLLGNTYYKKGKLKFALACYREALPLAKTMLGKCDPVTLDIIDSIGVCHLSSKRYKRALRYFEVELKRLDNSGDTVRIARTHNNIGESHFCMGNYGYAAEQFEKARKLIEFNKDTNEQPLIDNFYSLADAYFCSGKYAKAIRHIKNAIRLQEERLSDSDLRSLAFEYSKAIKFFDFPTGNQPPEKYREIIAICHQKLLENEENPGIDKGYLAKNYFKLYKKIVEIGKSKDINVKRAA